MKLNKLGHAMNGVWHARRLITPRVRYAREMWKLRRILKRMKCFSSIHTARTREKFEKEQQSLLVTKICASGNGNV